MTWYKAFDKDLKCKGMQYEIGGEYKLDGEPIICNQGFHYCKSIADCYMFYPMLDNTRICEVEPLGEVVSDKDGIKFCTNHIKIVREIENPRELSNTSKLSSGYCNSGYHNSGNCNTGYRNNGNYNTGYRNNGNYNSGNCNSGSYNTGSYNTGDCNTGNHNSGSCNNGNYNSGNWNSGHCNTGDCNTGNYNSGNRNTGYHNSGSWNFGIFNTDKNPKIRIFDKESDWTMTDWRCSRVFEVMCSCPYTTTDFVYESDMSDEDKFNHPEYTTIGGYLKTTVITKEDKQKWWDNLPDKDKQAVYSLPNFDADKFEKCTGIKVDFDSKPDNGWIEIERITEMNFIRKESEAVNDIQKLQK